MSEEGKKRDDDGRRAKHKLRRLEKRRLAESTLAESSPSGVPQADPAVVESAILDLPAPRLEYRMIGGRRYVQKESTVVGTRLLDTPGRIVLTMAYGQSNAEAGGLGKRGKHERVVTKGIIDEHRAMMLDTGLLGPSPDSQLEDASPADFVPAREDSVAGESGGSAFLRYSLVSGDAAALPDAVHLYRSAGQKGQPIVRLHENTQPYRNFLAAVERSRSISESYGKTLCVPHFLWDHGEADRKRGTNPETYSAEMLRLRNRLDLAIRRITRQPEPVWMLVTILVAPGMQVSSTGSDITLAQVATLAQPGIAPVCSPYWFCEDYGFCEGQAVHWSPLAKSLLREFGARAARIVREAMSQNRYARLGEWIHRQVYEPDTDGGSWTSRRVPFETSPRTDESTVRRVDNRITGEVIYAEGGLSILSGGRGMAENLGFSWSGDGRISDVDVENEGPRSRWIVTLSAPSSGVLSYATELQQGPESNGPRKWGNLFDNCAEPSIAVPGMTLRQGMLPFLVTVE